MSPIMPPDRPPPSPWPHSRVAALAARLEALLAAAPARAGRIRVLAIEGPSGAGKTSLAAALSPLLGAPVLALEDVYPGWDGLAAAVPRVRDGVLAPFAAGRPGRYRRWDWERGRDGEPVDVPEPASGRLILEGAGSGSRELAPYESVLVWVEAPEEVRHARAMARDGETYRPHWDRWAAQERAQFAVHEPRARADVVVAAPDAGVD
jgi:hypothetical protein